MSLSCDVFTGLASLPVTSLKIMDLEMPATKSKVTKLKFLCYVSLPYVQCPDHCFRAAVRLRVDIIAR